MTHPSVGRWPLLALAAVVAAGLSVIVVPPGAADLQIPRGGVALAQAGPSTDPGQLLPVGSAAPGRPGAPAAATIAPTGSPEVSLGAGGAFVASAYDTWGTGLVEPLQGSRLELSLLSAGRLEGRTGCGTFSGGYTVDGQAIRLGVVNTDTEPCRTRRADEAFGFTQALSAVTLWAAAPDGIELLDDAGLVRVRLQRSGAVSPAGDWLIARYALPDGDLGSAVEGSGAALLLAADGSVSGQTGCRTFEGSYLAESDRIVLAPTVIVGLPCEEDSGPLVRQDRRLLAAFDAVVNWRHQGDRLEMLDGAGAVVLELVARPGAAASPSPAAGLPAATSTPSAAGPSPATVATAG